MVRSFEGTKQTLQAQKGKQHYLKNYMYILMADMLMTMAKHEFTFQGILTQIQFEMQTYNETERERERERESKHGLLGQCIQQLIAISLAPAEVERIIVEIKSKQYFSKYYQNLVNPLCSEFMEVFNLTQALFDVCAIQVQNKQLFIFVVTSFKAGGRKPTLLTSVNIRHQHSTMRHRVRCLHMQAIKYRCQQGCFPPTDPKHTFFALTTHQYLTRQLILSYGINRRNHYCGKINILWSGFEGEFLFENKLIK